MPETNNEGPRTDGPETQKQGKVHAIKEQEADNRKMGIGPRIQYFLIRGTIMLLGRIAAVAPERITYAICVGFTLFARKAFPKFRQLARGHLEIAFGAEKPAAEIDDILRRAYINLGKNFAEFLMLPHKSSEWIENRVDFDDPHFHIRAELEKGLGVVSLGGHFGSWELVGARIGIYKYPLVVVVKAQRDAFMTRFVMETRTKWGNEYIFRDHGIKEECYRQLEQNKILGLLADQNATRGVFVNFFGKPAATATGPAEIAMKRGIPVVPGFPARNPDNSITLHVLEPIQMRDTGDYDADLVYNLQQCSNAVENFAREHPDDYFWWHRRWKKRPPSETQKK
ncbi:MAG: lysophospholipid acyltransferase family protein [bacterium]